MKKILSISLVVLMYVLALPVNAENRPGSSTYSNDILDLVYATARDNQEEDLLIDDQAIDDYVKMIHTVGPSYYSATDQKTYYVFDYKGIENFENLAELTAVIDLGTMGESGTPKKIQNLTILPQEFTDNSGEIQIFAGEYSKDTGTYEQLGDTYWGDTDPATAKTLAHAKFNEYQSVFVSELTSMSTQYSGPRVGVPLDGFDALLVNLNWMVGLNRNLNFDVEAEMVTRHIRRPVHLETLNDSLYYAMTLQDEDIPSVIRKEGNTFQKANATQKTVGIDLDRLADFVDDHLGDFGVTTIPFKVIATLEDGRTFEADRVYRDDIDKDYDDERYTFFYDYDSSDSIVGSIQRIDFYVAKMDIVAEQLTKNSELYEAYDRADIEDIGSYMDTDFYAMDQGLVLHSYSYNGFDINRDSNVITPTYLPAFDAKYDVYFDSHGGDAVAPILQVYLGAQITKPTDPTKSNAIFKGWFTDNTYTTPWNFGQDYVEKTITLHAKWEELAVDTYDVTFESNGGTAIAPQHDLEAGAKVVKPNDPTRSGHTFAGWYTSPTFEKLWNFDADTVQNSMTLYAKWNQNPIVNTYDVTFESNGGTAVAPQHNLEAGAKVVKPNDPTRSGYTFAGWYTSPTFEKLWNFDTDTVQNSMTLYAKWNQNPIVNTYDVTFESNGGTVVAPQHNLEAGAKVVKPNDPTRSGYTFAGWYTSPTFEKLWNFDADTVQNSMTLYAKWDLKEAVLPATGYASNSAILAGSVVAGLGLILLSLHNKKIKQ